MAKFRMTNLPSFKEELNKQLKEHGQCSTCSHCKKYTKLRYLTFNSNNGHEFDIASACTYCSKKCCDLDSSEFEGNYDLKIEVYQEF